VCKNRARLHKTPHRRGRGNAVFTPIPYICHEKYLTMEAEELSMAADIENLFFFGLD
jgi:hypothetical protein